MKQLVVLGLVLFSMVVVAQDTFIAITSNRWDRTATWNCGGCNRIPNNAQDIVYTNGYSVTLQANFSPTVKDLYVSVNLRPGTTTPSLRKQGGGSNPVITVTGQLSGYDYLTGVPATPSSTLFGGQLNFIFTGSNLNQPTDPVITSWSGVSPFYTATFQPAAGVTLYTDLFSVTTTLLVASGTVILESSGASTTVDVGTTFTNNGVFDINGYEINVIDVLTNSGTLIGNGGSIYAYNDFTNTGVLNMDNSFLEVSGLLLNNTTCSIENGTALLFGDFENNGSVVATNSTFEFASGGTQSILGTSPVTFADMVVNGSTVVVESDHQLEGILTLDGASAFDGDGSLDNAIFTLLSTNDDPVADAAIATLPPGAAITGKVRVQRYMNPTEGPILNGEVYRLISSAVQSATVADIQNEIPVTGTFIGASDPEGCNGACGPAMWSYIEATPGIQDIGYEAFPTASSAETLQPGKGYLFYQWGNTIATVPSVWDVNGIPNQGEIDFNVSYTAQSGADHDGWNLIGNPYPSAIDWDSPIGWTRSGLSDFFYTADYVSDTYTTYMLGGLGTNGGTQYIPTGQGFWVQSVDGSASMTINENAKAAGQQTTFYRTKTEEAPIILRMKVQGAGRSDESLVLFREDATHDFDPKRDAVKMMNSEVNLSTRIGERNFVINSLSDLSICGTTVPMSITEVKPGTYTFLFSETDSFDENIRIELIDHFTEQKVDIRNQETYSFTVSSNAQSFGAARFELTFSANTASISTLEDGTLKSNFEHGNQWYLNGVPIEGANNHVYEPVVSGKYTLRVGNGTCISEDELVYAVTGLEETIEGLYSVYPNPVGNTVLTVRVPVTDVIEGAVLYNNTGVQVGILEFDENENHKISAVDMSSLSNGIYLIRYISDTGIRIFKISKH